MEPLRVYYRRRRRRRIDSNLQAGIQDLPSAVLILIFIRLPMKYLLRLTSVCKSYNAIIRGQEFRRFHLETITMKNAHDYLLVRNKIGNEERGFSIYSARTFTYDENSGLPRSIDIPMRHSGHDLHFWGFTVYGSCNGVLCISLTVLSFTAPLYLYNPSLGKFRELPPSGFKLPKGTTSTYVTLGFGFLSETDDYQVVRLVYSYQGFFYAEVYSVKLNSWTELKNAKDPRENAAAWFMEGCTCLDGVIYWQLRQEPQMYLVHFNMNTSVLDKRPLPNHLRPVMIPVCLQVLYPVCLRVWKNNVQVLEKSLCLFRMVRHRCRNETHDYCEIWDLKGNTEELVHKIRLPPDASIAWPLGFSTNGNVAYLVIEEDTGPPFLSQYAIPLQRRQAKILQISGCGWFVDAYRESLVLLDEI